MYSLQNTATISDLRKNTLKVLRKIEKTTEPITIFIHSKPVAVVMSMALYGKMKNPEDSVDQVLYKQGLDFFINPPKKILLKKKKQFNVVNIIRKDREEWLN